MSASDVASVVVLACFDYKKLSLPNVIGYRLLQTSIVYYPENYFYSTIAKMPYHGGMS